ncbi:M23 family metallopeptidase [Paenibacillus massiliensis]|uniref:M23 family metallopeptidase n=1 Tax=Paenibacillus massiliensis TaxID=225917 RepID=UPI000471C908|nr:M23 family metallopeptidase [Paenibacillus massiliensis]
MSNPFEGYRLTSPFGYRMHPVDKVKRFHRGVDLVISPANGEIKAFTAGKVLHAKMGVTGSGFGNMGIVVAIQDDKGYLHVYAHLSSASVKVGQKVEQGQVIGHQGSTGKSTGPHLHYEIRKAASPQYGYTATEAGVVEPTQYLINYYGQQPKEDEEPMTAEERKQLETLQETVKQQAAAIKKLEQYNSMPEIPEWAKDACVAAKKAGIVDNTAGRSYDFYSLLTVLRRAKLF